MKKSSLLIGLLALNLPSIALAGSMGPIGQSPWMKVVTLSGGPIWANGGELQTLYFSPELSRTYTIDNTNHSLAEGEIFIGAQRNTDSRFESQIGVAFLATTRLKISGHIWDFEDPRFDNYTNTYTLQHSHVALKGKLLSKKTRYSLKPWVSGSIGIGFNKSANYNVVPLICEVIPLPSANFPSHRQTAFTYTLGAGVQRVLNENWQIGIGYEFADWGKSRLGGAPAQPTGSKGLSLNHLYTNGLLFNLTWLA